MNIAFYAPMKSPNHPQPSGDRRIARLLSQALQLAGHDIELMSELRAWEGRGDQAVQSDIQKRAEIVADEIVQKMISRPAEQQADIWFSYHLYHKAPDWIGPRVAAQLQIPYIVAEASYAPKQVQGPWSVGLKQVRHALNQAAAIVCLNPCDIPSLKQLDGMGDKIHSLKPFLDTGEISLEQKPVARRELAKRYDLDPVLPWVISVAMMRDDVKLVSYRHLAVTLSLLQQPCQCLLIGDGIARPQVEALFTGGLGQRTRFSGQLSHTATQRAMIASDLFVWPAINEAIGMAILEAQACGLPVIAGASGAIPGLVLDQQTGFICSPDQTHHMAKRTDQLLMNSGLRRKYSDAAIDRIRRHHSLEAAATALEHILDTLVH